MKLKKIILATLALAILGGATLAISKLGPMVVHAQSLTNQVQQTVSQKESSQETQNTQEKDVLGMGHQDASGAVDHQFEGEE